MNYQDFEIIYTQEFLDEVQEIFDYLKQNASERIAKSLQKPLTTKLIKLS